MARPAGDGVSVGIAVTVTAAVAVVGPLIGLLSSRGTSLVLTPGALVHRSPPAGDRVVAPAQVAAATSVLIAVVVVVVVALDS